MLVALALAAATAAQPAAAGSAQEGPAAQTTAPASSPDVPFPSTVTAQEQAASRAYATRASRAPTARTGPWLEIAAGPELLHRSGRPGLGSGPQLRLSLGKALGERFLGELWLSGTLESAPYRAPGDQAIGAAGLGGRVLLKALDPVGRLAFWARAGLGWSVATPQDATRGGPTGFVGGVFELQPVLRRFAVSVELDALGMRRGIGLAVLPSLRCAL